MGSRLLSVLAIAIAFGLVAPQLVCGDDASSSTKKEEKKGDSSGTVGTAQKPPQPPAPPAPPKPPVPQPPKAVEQPKAPAAAQPAPVAKVAPAPAPAPAPAKAAPAPANPPGDEKAKPAPTPAPMPGKAKVARFQFTGNAAISTPELEASVSSWVGKEVSLDDIRQIADQVTKVYRDRGFTVAKAYVPAQEIKDGVVTIQVLEGKLGQIIVRGNTNYSTEFIQSRMATAAPDGALNQEKLERALLLLNEFQDLHVTATLVPGKAPGTVDIVADVKNREFPFSATIDYNNFGNEGTGKSRFGMQVDWSNAIINGGHLSVRGVIGDEGDNYDYARGAYTFPISDSGTNVGVWGYWGTFEVDHFFRELDINGESWGTGAYVTHPCIKGRDLSLTADVGLDIKDTETFIVDEQNANDEIRMLHFGANFDNACWNGRNFASLYIYTGLSDFLGGMDDDSQSSRKNADDEFAHFNLSFTRVQNICDWLDVLLRANGQWATNPLVAGEMMQIGGADSVRGYQSGEASGDDGYTVSIEPRVTFTHDPEQWYVPQFAAFFDNGGAFRRDPLIGEPSASHLSGAGCGLRWACKWNIDLRFDVAWPIGDDPAGDDDGAQYYVAGSVKF